MPKKRRPKYEAVDALIDGPLIPMHKRVPKSPDRVGKDISRFQGPTTSPGKARADYVEISEAYRKDYESGNLHAVFKILEINPEFLMEPWVQAALLNMRLRGLLRSAKQHYGRKWGGTNMPRGLLVGLLWLLKSQMKTSMEQVIARVYDNDELRRLFPFSESRLRELYYDTLRSKRLKPILVALGPWKDATPEESAAAEREPKERYEFKQNGFKATIDLKKEAE